MAPNSVFDIGLTPLQLTVYLYMVRCSNNSNGAFPSISTVQKKCGASRPTIIKIIQELEELGLLRKHRRQGKKGNESNFYEVIDPDERLHQGHDPSKPALPPLGNEFNHPGKGDLPYKELQDKKQDDKKEYIALTSDGHLFLQIYDEFFKNKFGKRHPRISPEQLSEIMEKTIYLEEYGIGQEEFEEAVWEHFDKLPESNDGKIFAFYRAAYRYFDVRPDIDF